MQQRCRFFMMLQNLRLGERFCYPSNIAEKQKARSIDIERAVAYN